MITLNTVQLAGICAQCGEVLGRDGKRVFCKTHGTKGFTQEEYRVDLTEKPKRMKVITRGHSRGRHRGE